MLVPTISSYEPALRRTPPDRLSAIDDPAPGSYSVSGDVVKRLHIQPICSSVMICGGVKAMLP